jgi:hypothetical protein
MRCPTCKIRDLVVIKMRLGADPIVLRTCSSCGWRDWEGLDGTLGLDALLDLARPCRPRSVAVST